MSRGFSLLEMTIVLAILVLLLGGMLTPLSTIRENEQIRATKATIIEAFNSSQGFTALHERLPCPDHDGDGDGEVSDSGGNFVSCEAGGDAVEGFLPWRRLGLQKRFDAWGQPFRYRILKGGAKRLQLGMKSELRLVDWRGIPLTETIPKNSHVAVLIYSVGKDLTANIIRDEATYSGVGTGDDIVNWLSIYQFYFVSWSE